MLGVVDDETIRALVVRLSRKDRSGGGTIERAAILAEGSDLDAVVDWILARGGKPETTAATGPARGLHSSLRSSDRIATTEVPRRYLLPAGWLERHDQQ
jgi:hypothetical protein